MGGLKASLVLVQTLAWNLDCDQAEQYESCCVTDWWSELEAGWLVTALDNIVSHFYAQYRVGGRAGNRITHQTF